MDAYDASTNARVVAAGFEPFDGREENRSWALVQGLRGRPGTEVICLPVEFRRLDQAVARMVSSRPRAILMVGEAPTTVLRVEQIGLNVADSERPDNAGWRPRGEPVVPGGALALGASWDARRLAGRLQEEGIAARVSFHAGTFACNAALYRALHLSREAEGTEDAGGGAPAAPRRPAVGFLHVPNVREPAGLCPVKLGRALELGVDELLSSREEA